MKPHENHPFLAGLFALGCALLLQLPSDAQLRSTDDSRFQVDEEGTLIAASGASSVPLEGGLEAGASFQILFQVPEAAELTDLDVEPELATGQYSLVPDPEVEALVHERFAPTTPGFRWVGSRCTIEEAISADVLDVRWQLTFEDYPSRDVLAEHPFRVFWLLREFGASPTLESWQIYPAEEVFGEGARGRRGGNTLWALVITGLVLGTGALTLRSRRSAS